MTSLAIVFFVVCLLITSGQTLQCPDDWVNFEDSCYVIIDEIVPWATAEAYCRILHAKMLEVESQRENDFIVSQIAARNGIISVWQGANDLAREGRWVFNSNGHPLTWFNWHQGQPDNSHVAENGEDCIMISADGTWDDRWCEYIKEGRPSPACEIGALEDVVIGHAQQCPDDWVHFEDSCYLFIDEIVPWSTAETYCRILHAKVLEVESQRENDFIAAQIGARTGFHAVWQGINDLVREGRWNFNRNGQPVTWFNWLSGERNNSHVSENGQDCVQIYASGKWEDVWCEYLNDALPAYLNNALPSPVCEMAANQGVIG